MTENFALVASILTLVAISGRAFAETAAPNAWFWPEATGRSDRQVVHAFNPAMAVQTAKPNAQRRHRA
jgi:hypothetical protein